MYYRISSWEPFGENFKPEIDGHFALPDVEGRKLRRSQHRIQPQLRGTPPPEANQTIEFL
jgi:hypothetical protein